MGFPQGLRAAYIFGYGGTAEAVPSPKLLRGSLRGENRKPRTALFRCARTLENLLSEIVIDFRVIAQHFVISGLEQLFSAIA